MEECSDAPLILTHFYVRRHFVTLLLCCYLTHDNNNTDYWQECSISTVIPPATASDTVGQHSGTGGITFRAPQSNIAMPADGNRSHVCLNEESNGAFAVRIRNNKSCTSTSIKHCSSFDRLCGLVVRILGNRPAGLVSIPGATRFSEK
jgi:hypothetical protein